MRQTKKLVQLTSIGFMLCLALAGCGNASKSTSGNNNTTTNDLAEDVENDAENVVDDAGDAVEDIADGAGDIIEDVADGAGNVMKDAGSTVDNAVDDLVGTNGFTNYNDAQNFFLNSMSAYHADATFEIRNADRELNDYQEGSKGYHFELYDTSKNKSGDLFGEFFVDANSGQIYKKDKNGKIIEYPNQAQATANRKKTANNTTKKNTKNTKSSSATSMR